MASVHRNPDSPFWHGAYRDARGIRRKLSTKTKDRAKALAMVNEFEKTAKKARAGTLIEIVARDTISRIVEETTGEPLAFETMQSWADGWIAGKAATKSKGTATRYGSVVRDFLQHLGARARLNIALLREADVESFRAAELEAGKSSNTVNSATKTIATMLNAAQRRGLITINVASVEPLPDDRTEKHGFTRSQLAMLIRAADAEERKDMATLSRLGYYTGARIGDLARLRRHNIDWKKETAEFLPQKTRRKGRKLFVPVHAALMEYLRGLDIPDDLDGPLMPSLVSKRVQGENGLSANFARLVAKAGIVVPTLREAVGTKGRRVLGLGFHGLRHTFISGLLNAGVSSENRKRLSGHAIAGAHETYSHAEIETLRVELNKLPRIES